MLLPYLPLCLALCRCEYAEIPCKDHSIATFAEKTYAGHDVVMAGVVRVEVPGIEPGSSGASSGLLRAQLTVPLLGPTDHVSESV
jgi:hypothetical protein